MIFGITPNMTDLQQYQNEKDNFHCYITQNSCDIMTQQNQATQMQMEIEKNPLDDFD